MIYLLANCVQVGYVVERGGLDAALDYWVTELGAGPFFRGALPLYDQIYRGRQVAWEVECACGYLGDVQIELIDVRADGTSIYTEDGPRSPIAGRYHHMMIDQGDFDGMLQRFVGTGRDLVFSATPYGGGRVVYVDDRRYTGGYVEIVDSTSFPELVRKMRAARLGWDGSSPVRSFDEVT